MHGSWTALPPIVAVISPQLAVVRIHGRRTETWDAKGIPVVERFRYLYGADELGEWVPRIRQAAGQVKNLHLLMTNWYANHGTTNAFEIAAMLAGGGRPIVCPPTETGSLCGLASQRSSDGRQGGVEASGERARVVDHQPSAPIELPVDVARSISRPGWRETRTRQEWLEIRSPRYDQNELGIQLTDLTAKQPTTEFVLLLQQRSRRVAAPSRRDL